ncbi:spore maturation protein B [Paraliobacillus ryukyuensis]|uniref:Spore maturation protein B n=1 Tax=Paraliobacillus ryukyuensis TaxID=200904 RepID=A0A366EJ94_9BACI|nr:spore maturation protein [Paraliobacillus ryukyuensis]RBP01495.1 spore maturation protein B [Paraliobacillus ryukyuensis]
MSVITTISIWIIPVIVMVILLTATIQKLPAYELFVEGGKEGISIAVSLLPYLLGMMVSITIFRSSGALEAIIDHLHPFLQLVGIPGELVPLAFTRPISGTAALAITTDLISTYGPDSFIGRLASTMQGSTDTTFYILTVYFGSVGIKKMGDALKVGLLADLVGIITSIIIVSIVF